MDYSLYDNGPEIEIVRAWIFRPLTDFKPLYWIMDLFDYRIKLVAIDKKDSRGQVIKLDINAIYGKMAQRIGRKGKPPKYASLWYAAAITAGTQRQLIEAALTKPDDIIAFATDGIYATEELHVSIPAEKRLGEWEMQKGDKGSFIQSGVYTVHLLDKEGRVEIKAKSRGFTPDNTDKREGETYKDVLDRTLRESIPDKWANGDEGYSFPYQQYMTVGLSVQHRKFGGLVGCWKLSPRELSLNSMSNKRIVPGEPKKDATKRTKTEYKLTQKEIKLRESRAKKLIPLQVRHIIGPIEISGEAHVDWIDEKTRLERMEVRDGENVAAGLN